MTGSSTSPFGIDTTVPSTARMYDWWLGGKDNFAVDRATALAVSEAAPEARLMAVENRKFLRRAVRYLAAEAGITQFLDIGTGLPTQGNVHQVAQAVSPGARVVYADNDPMVIAHSRALKTGGNTVVIEADLRDPWAIVATIRGAIPPGSYLVLSHVTGDIRREFAAQAAVHYKNVTSGATLRSREEILRLFTGLELIDPGLVQVPNWRPDDEPADGGKVWILGGVGHKPGPLAAKRT